MIQENIKLVEENIKKACEKVGRDVNEVTLIAVSKTKPYTAIEEALPTGVKDYGENKVQELCDKYEILPKDIKWHMIGHLQRNKVKYLVGKASLIHSVDSIRLAEQIEKEYAKADEIANILIEVNMAQEESKFGITSEETEQLVREIAKFPHIRIKGLMTIAPYTDNPESNRVYFRNMKKLSVDIENKNIDNVSMSVLSMGMTGDYQVAVEEGATLVRVGTGIFGERNYNI
ncbi:MULTISPECIES: YggS family pyridoxal phosphate-dependent enzyme [Eubacterium]|jgi:pyridoxal phosphate enzyme (YggS family)|uniref:Pyridoxal phosphate homeostasis protein n=1 Tax=Eubacterium album TaxID=2978477 RepID=A0ABT2M1G9_9FIRM|nr:MULTISPECIES: YggS family pyridoxal phosphate-dependent enzyme [unclassified Eubacterium (in: firmicutes)]MCT7399356.1 YggS family pyridoxal phosphate-dependent enzyme [Eubacterium sp. LFL-14]RGG66665.1 YggS family pyridoxal phosphate-dependent enzyme [Eubacterium sp. AF17-7]RHR36557.1 YggS family pyridoxal phosphate-dependent enzyme [Eubacterium sp. AF19-12LB]CDA28212.1 pyridoxal phosphate enzyme YggS family [Eubacterium sp. CAG:156]